MNECNKWTLQDKTHSLKTAMDFIAAASQRGDLEEVQSLWNLVDAKFPTRDAAVEAQLKTIPITVAARQGHTHVVNHLISLSTLDNTNDALNSAARNGHLECLRVLAPHYPISMLSVALTEAACTNHVDCVHELLAMNPPNIHDDYEVCLIWASANKNKPLLEYFYSRCNPDRALEISEWWEEDELEMLVHYHSPEGQNERLNENLTSNAADKKKAKI